MTRLTVAQLSSQIEAINAAYEKLATERESLIEECGALQAKCEAAELREADMANLMEYAAGTQALWINVEHEEFMRVMREELKPRARAWTTAPDDLVARRAAMAAAKAEAARTGRSVRAW